MGGVGFELLATGQGRGNQLSLEPDAARYCLSARGQAQVAQVLCSVTIDSALDDATRYGDLELTTGAIADLDRGELSLSAPRVRATLCRLAPRRYACSAHIASDPRALTVLLRSIVAVVVHDVGGLMMHAAGIALDGRAVLFVGPSGAGKSTAATLTRGARMFASDHVAVVPHDGEVQVFGMPGGTTAAMPYSDRIAWPLALILRVRRDGPSAPQPHAPRARAVDGAEALFIAREAVESPDLSPFAEAKQLAGLVEVMRALKIGTIHTVLGHPISDLVRGIMRDEGCT